MKNLLSILLLTISTTLFATTAKPGVAYDTKIIRVIDGDTVVFAAPFLPPPLKPELSLRIYGVDTPEKGSTAKCDLEVQRGKAATVFTKEHVNSATTKQINIMEWDKYGGRVLGDVILDGKSLRDLLIESGNAREYFGGFKKSWCN